MSHTSYRKNQHNSIYIKLRITSCAHFPSVATRNNASQRKITLQFPIVDNNDHTTTTTPITKAFDYFWLRDNCPSELHPKSNQRLADTSKLSLNVTPTSDPRITYISTSAKGPTTPVLSIKWSDGHTSNYPEAWLRQHAERQSKGVFHHPATQIPTSATYVMFIIIDLFVDMSLIAVDQRSAVLWGGNYFTDAPAGAANRVPEIDYTALMAEEGAPARDQWALKKLLSHLASFGFCIITSTPATPEASRKACERIGRCKSTMFGDFWDLTVESAAPSTVATEFSDTAYTPLTIAPHTDGTYLVDPPGLQSFHILHHHGSGGFNQLVDGWRVGKLLQQHHPASWNLLSQLPIEFYYTDQSVSYRTEAPVFKTNARCVYPTIPSIISVDLLLWLYSGDIIQFRWNNHDRCPPAPDAPNLKEYHEAVRSLQALVQDPANHFSLKLTPGKLLITNNWRVLHGRSEMAGSRRLVGCYISMDDYLSNRRILARNSESNWQLS
jgi:trimethyllysine dioxygenase